MEEFKFIYFWEWGHRMWGRALGERSGWGTGCRMRGSREQPSLHNCV